MKTKTIISILLSGLCLTVSSCGTDNGLRYSFPDIIDISLTPEGRSRHTGTFTDAGSWIGFTIPDKDKWTPGFCGPFSLEKRDWFATSAISVTFAGDTASPMQTQSCYYPGEARISYGTGTGNISQSLVFIDHMTALLTIGADTRASLSVKGNGWNEALSLSGTGHSVIAESPAGETLVITFPEYSRTSVGEGNYSTVMPGNGKTHHVAVSFVLEGGSAQTAIRRNTELLKDPETALEANSERWERYLKSVLRSDMAPEYDRIAVKSVVTLISNWRKERGGLLHEGVIPSHAVNYFVGFWAWDTWRFSAALAGIEPELAKNNIRAMFDYQTEDGMIIDCIFPNPEYNNARDSKPPIASWAVNEIFEKNADTSFVREMYPKLMEYYKWWFEKRDHDGNGICEFGSTDGTLVAAAWESGMDNAIRFDDTEMLKNGEGAWSMNQESVDLNGFLALEARYLKKFAEIAGAEFDAPDTGDRIAEYFFDPESGYFYDRRLSDGSFIKEPACEGYNPFWTGIASEEQMEKALSLLTDENKFSTYIPFPTAAADNPKTSEDGYWRGPIWLDQTYFAIKGLRNYGYTGLADKYTMQVFDRLQGLKQDAPIYENYGTHDGRPLQASHFSWSAAHLLMMYEDYGK